MLQCAECHLHCYLHVFLTSADKAYRQMKAMKESQSIIVSGKFIPVCILLKSDLQF